MHASYLIGGGIIVVLALVFPAIIFYRVFGSVAKGVAADASPEEMQRAAAAKGGNPPAASKDAED